MTFRRFHRIAYLLALVIAAPALLAACQGTAPPLTPKEQAFMSHYTAHMVPHCFGRYQIDLPADMRLAPESGATFAIFPYSEMSGAIHVTVMPMTKTAFDAKLARRKAELESQHIDLHPEWAVLGGATPISGGDGEILNWADGLTRSARVLELHSWKDSYAIVIKVKALDESFPEDAGDPPELKAGADLHKKLAMLQSFYTRISGRSDSEMPTGPGACFKNGFVSGPASDDMREDITVNYVSTSLPDVTLTLSSDTGIRTSDTLLERAAGIREAFAGGHGHILHKGSLASDGGVEFDELLTESTHPDGQVLGQHFALEANSKKGGSQTPLVNVEMGTGNWQDEQSPKYVKSSLTKAESVDLWNDITRSLRKRPGAF